MIRSQALESRPSRPGTVAAAHCKPESPIGADLSVRPAQLRLDTRPRRCYSTHIGTFAQSQSQSIYNKLDSSSPVSRITTIVEVLGKTYDVRVNLLQSSEVLRKNVSEARSVRRRVGRAELLKQSFQVPCSSHFRQCCYQVADCFLIGGHNGLPKISVRILNGFRGAFRAEKQGPHLVATA